MCQRSMSQYGMYVSLGTVRQLPVALASNRLRGRTTWPAEVSTRTVRGDGVDLCVYEWGAQDRAVPVILLVHGYPDNARVWNRLAPLLARNYRVVAYDVRGAGRSDHPRAVAAYRLEHLIADMTAVIDSINPDGAVHLVAHDWGSLQGWEAVTTKPLSQRVASYTTISGPGLDHVGHWFAARWQGAGGAGRMQAARQLAHSWYVFAFHVPVLFPLAWHCGLARLWPVMLKRAERLDVSPDPTQAGDGATGVKLYRANVLERLRHPRQRHADMPVQLVVARYDRFVTTELLEDVGQWASQLWRRDIDTGHWVQLSDPGQLAEWVEEFVDFVEGGSQSAGLKRARVPPSRGRGERR